MSDSTLHIGALASNNVNNIVNEAGKYDEYKEKVKDLTKEIQTRKDTFEKMAEPLVYVCEDVYKRQTGDIGAAQEEEILTWLQKTKTGADVQKIDFYKAAHHGSRYSNSTGFLESLRCV